MVRGDFKLEMAIDQIVSVNKKQSTLLHSLANSLGKETKKNDFQDRALYILSSNN